jgi:hypothetical protein
LRSKAFSEAGDDARRKNMHLSMASFYELGIKRGVFEPQNVSYHSMNRLLGNHKLLHTSKESAVQRKRFAYDTVNTLWQGDASVGPRLAAGNTHENPAGFSWKRRSNGAFEPFGRPLRGAAFSPKAKRA